MATWTLLFVWLLWLPRGAGGHSEQIYLENTPESANALLLQQVSDLQDRIVRVRSAIDLRFDTGATGKVALEYTYGSGVFISENGLIVTAQHLIRRRDKLPPTRRETSILFHGAHSYIPVDIIAEDRRADIALLRVSPRALPFRKCFSLAQPPGPPVGSRSYVLGIRAAAPPESFEAGVIEGVFIDGSLRLAELYKNDMEERGPWVAISQQIFPGYSGGAILNASGALTGIVVGAPELRGEWRDFSFGVSAQAIERLLLKYKNEIRSSNCYAS